MNQLIQQAWQLYHDSRAITCVVRPSMPILYFGDLERYVRSPLRIVTVGLNPSAAEFPSVEPFRRFPNARHVYPRILEGLSSGGYRAALNAYFRCEPYMSWFSTLEPLLDGMDAGYRDGRANTALHTNLCSPLATLPTWSRLTHDERRLLETGGAPLWLRLIRQLVPDVILVSVARHHLATLDFLPVRPWETIHIVERAHPYRVEAQEVEVVPGHHALIVFGRASRKPFGSVSTEAKREIGRRVAERVSGRQPPPLPA